MSIFPDLENIEDDAFKVRYRETLQPLITYLPARQGIAGNNGFGGMGCG